MLVQFPLQNEQIWYLLLFVFLMFFSYLNDTIMFWLIQKVLRIVNVSVWLQSIIIFLAKRLSQVNFYYEFHRDTN